MLRRLTIPIYSTKCGTYGYLMPTVALWRGAIFTAILQVERMGCGEVLQLVPTT